MDALWWIEHLWVLFMVVFGWLGKSMWDAVQELKRDVHMIQIDLPERYVSKSDMVSMMTDIKAALARIENRIDHMGDR